MAGRAGFARVDITPAIGAEIPGDFVKNLAKGVHDRLWVEAAFLSDGATELAIVGADLVMIPRDVVEEARRQITVACGMPGHHVMLAASHTHTGGPIVDCFASERDPAYCAHVSSCIALAVRDARDKAVPCRLATVVGHEDTVAFNRRFRVKDGTCKTHPGKMNTDIVEPAGPVDPEVGVIAVTGLDGAHLGCIVNYALHGTTMSDDRFSADWPSYLRETLRSNLGESAGIVFVNGACGDVTQVDNRDPRAPEFGEEWARLVGTRVALAALRALGTANFQESFALAAAVETIPMAIRDLGDSDEALVERETPAIGLGSGGRDTYRREAALLRAAKAVSPTVDVELQAFRIGDAALVANPAELFCELGLAIKEHSPWHPTFVVELANGYVGYAPTAKAFREGGYEIRTARSSYLVPEAGDLIAGGSVALLNRMKTQ